MAFVARASGTAEALAVSLGEIKNHLRITHELEDQDVTMRSWAAQRAITAHVGPLVESAWDWTLDRFVSGSYLQAPAYMASVTAIYYRPPTGPRVEFTDYVVDAESRPLRIFTATGKSWPTAELRPAGGVVIELNAGWPIVDGVPQTPEPLKMALLLLVGHYYRNREAVILEGSAPRELPMGVASLIEPYRIHGSGWLCAD